MKRLLLTLALLFVFTGCGPKKDEGKLVVGMECNYAPYNWAQANGEGGAVPIDGSSSFAGGYDVEIAKKLAESLGKDLVVKQISWDGLIPALNAGTIDMIIAGMSETPERAKSVAFTKAYYVTDFVVLTSKTGKYKDAKKLEDFSGARFIGQKSTFYDTIIDQIPQVDHLAALNTVPLIINAINTGVCDGTVVENIVADAVVKTNPDLEIVRFDQGQGFKITEDINNTVSIAVKKDRLDLKEKLDTALAKISEEERQSLMEKAIENQVEVGN